MATAHLTWSGESKGENVQGNRIVLTYQQKWRIIDATTANAASTAPGLPLANQEMTPGSAFRVSNRQIVPDGGPTTWMATITFAVPENGSFQTPEENPLLRPFRLSWGEGLRQIPMDQDVKKRLVRNSAGSVFEPLPTRDIVVETLTCRRYEAIYDRAKARKYRNKVNSDNITIGGTTLLPGEMRCVRIGPVGEYEIDAPYVEIEYVFEIDAESRAENNQNGYPFDVHLVDQGTRGWYEDPADSSKLKLGWFCTTDANNKPIAILDSPILLDGTGKPLQAGLGDSTVIRIADGPDTGNTKKTYSPAAAPTRYHIDDDTRSPFSDGTKLIMWRFVAHESVPFTGIFA